MPLPGRVSCHTPFTIDLWPSGEVPFAHPDMYKKGQAPYLTAYVPMSSASYACDWQ